MIASKLLSKFGVIGVAGVCIASRAHALVIALEPAAGITVVAGQKAPVQVWLEGARDRTIGGLQFDLSPLASGAVYATDVTAADGFDESPVSPLLDLTIDGALTDDRTLAFAVDNGPGIPAGSEPVLVGTLWVGTPAGVVGNYAVAVQSPEVTGLDSSTLSATGGTIVVSATLPEPAGCGFTAFALLALSRRRSRSAI